MTRYRPRRGTVRSVLENEHVSCPADENFGRCDHIGLHSPLANRRVHLGATGFVRRNPVRSCCLTPDPQMPAAPRRRTLIRPVRPHSLAAVGDAELRGVMVEINPVP
jgi:hypothetical protein